MTISRDQYGEDNVARLNAFLNQFPEACDPEFDAVYDELHREFAPLRDINEGGAYA